MHFCSVMKRLCCREALSRFAVQHCVIACICIFTYHSDHDILHSHLNGISQCVISGFRAYLGYCAISVGNFLPTSRDKLSVQSSRFNNPNFLPTFRDNPPVPSLGFKKPNFFPTFRDNLPVQSSGFKNPKNPF